MKRFLTLIAVAVLAAAGLEAQEYPFRNPQLSDDERIDNLFSLMTLEEKIALFGGAGVPRLGIKPTGSVEAIHGAVMSGPPSAERSEYHYSTAFPQGYGLGETWDREMLKLVGETMSYEARYYTQNEKYGRNSLVMWAPNADLGRDPRWGRTEECFGEDAYLVGELSASMVRGIQGDHPKYWRTASLMKHFLANSNEDGRVYTSSNFGDRLFHEYYSYGFYKGVLAGCSSLMLAYNAWNGEPCTTNMKISDILYNRWKMDGLIITDGSAFSLLKTGHNYYETLDDAAVACVKAGIVRYLDKYEPYVSNSLAKGLITEAEIEKAARGNLKTMLRLGLLDADPSLNPYTKIGEGDEVEPWKTQKHKDAARLVARKSVVLLKNDGLLPLDKEKITKIAVIGNRADSVYRDWYGAVSEYRITPLQGIRNAVADKNIEVKFTDLDHDGKAAELAAWADVAIVCVGNHPVTSPDWGKGFVVAPWGRGTSLSDGREAVDRQSLQLDSEDLIKVVRKANPNTVVALISSFPYSMNWTVENVPSIVHMTHCGQETGNALADVIFGDYNPAGRTTQTWVRDITDLPNMLDYDITKGRTYMYFDGEPLFPFGHGLSYTDFKYSNMNVERTESGLQVTVDVENTGRRDGEEVVELYIKFPGDDANMRLKGFERVSIAKGEKKTVTLDVAELDLSLWCEEKDGWKLAEGKAVIKVGASSEDIRIEKKVNIK